MSNKPKPLPDWVMDVFALEPVFNGDDIPLFDRSGRNPMPSTWRELHRRKQNDYNELDFTMLASYGEAPNESD